MHGPQLAQEMEAAIEIVLLAGGLEVGTHTAHDARMRSYADEPERARGLSGPVGRSGA